MSSSAFDVVRTTTGIRFKSGSCLICASTSRPSFTGKLRSSRIRSGRTVSLYLPCLRKQLNASSPFEATIRLLRTLLSLSTSCVNRTSPALSSTSRMSIVCGCKSKFMVLYLLISLGFHRWNGETKCRASPRRSLHPDASAMPLHDFLANGQADARSGVFRLGMKALKDYEDPVAMLGRDANAVVAYGYLPVPSILLNGDTHARRFVSAELQGISEQVLKQLAELHGVAKNRGQAVTSDDGARLFDGQLQTIQDAVHHGLTPGRFQGLTLRAHARIGEQVADQCLHPGGPI